MRKGAEARPLVGTPARSVKPRATGALNLTPGAALAALRQRLLYSRDHLSRPVGPSGGALPASIPPTKMPEEPESLAVGDRRLQSGGFLGWNPPAEVAPILPDLMFEVGAAAFAGSAVPEFGLEAALFHGLEGCHLLKDLGALRAKFSIHPPVISSR